MKPAVYALFILALITLALPISGCREKEKIVTPTPVPVQKDVYYAPIDAELMPDGKILVLYATPVGTTRFVNKLVRFNEDGTLDSEFDLQMDFPHTITITAQDTYLISDHGNNRLLEIDGDGRVISEITDLKIGLKGFNFNSAVQLKGGNILASGRDWGVVELTKDGKIRWQIKLFKGEKPTFQEKGSHDATMLPNGNILYVSTSTNEVIETKTNGKVVRVITNENIRLPKNARLLANGNILVSHSRGLSEVDIEGNIIKENRDYKGCYNFKVLPKGRIMLSHYVRGVIFLNKKYKEKKAIKYYAPESWDVISKNVPEEVLETMRTLGYLQ